MRNFFKVFTLVLVVISVLLFGENKKLTAFDYNKMIGIGINMGNALEAPFEGAWGVVIKDEYFEIIKEKGFDSVRIPIRWSAHILDKPPYTIEKDFLERVKHVVDKALENDLIVIINCHHFEELYENPEKYGEVLLEIWKQVSSFFKDYSDKLYFEIYNEPAKNLTPEKWNDLYPKVLKEIRKTNPSRIVIVDVPHWGNYNYINQLKLVNDPYLIVSFHYYEPFNFTHQGAEWINPRLPVGVKWSAKSYEIEQIKSHFEYVDSFSKKYNVPIFLGEFGAYSKADMDSRIKWTKAVSQIAREFGFSICYWEFCSGFGLYNKITNTWNEGLLNAVFGK
ncbi:glycoside hydrolase family protein [Thermosipho africanus H17ap60334]|jgi:endoglucanase|uniref:glycoside hydrolase family 5 protein n=1 Tax=Thermosipho africanus TaxID=2421 RepID=UPI00028F0983|nr:glycoside hydrolase family 5 protein [Thermosipho africanus]MBZ4649863.1 glycoside hydrolase family 5 [Thermosipho sp. (in: thermotogales)]EKF50310.1 glycoside hydrolase family protein [Thermosipho africanus H17ap60334]MDK2839428.1 endoglucanase [Thermosipho sp. (in: thermotogales)]MDK2899799.1 endoglucanase [Thermosipho sp. (in: thermotogales)]HCF37783.1 endoglucanase [Thermosipho africanus]